MRRGGAVLLGLFLGLLRPGCGERARGQPLQVEPPEPVVAVAMGASLRFACRLACAGPGAAAVQWRGLDTSLGEVQSDARGSVLTVRNASLSAAGPRVCVGSCGNVTFQKTVRLVVYAFPDQLSVSPAALVPGVDREVACTAHKVMPAGPDALSFSLLLGDRELEGVQTLGSPEVEEEEPQEDEDPLFHVTERWLLPPLGTPIPPALHCQATMRLPGMELSHRQAIPVLHSLTSPEPPDTTSPELPYATSPEPPDVTSPEAPHKQGSMGTCCSEIHQAVPTEGGMAPKSSPTPGPAQLPTDLWTGSVVLALLLLSFLAYRLRKRCCCPDPG
ncbi:PREDICTED: mucosal addressin cell adhesion molecule 1 [Propithecus coquereli]|uniref:mucosal addressin cell adhesion molecule 1 n=1 Tax=Propithecus coquereli TaxID=379532 RepID=UPI00063F4D12|nr:PREDICTED: mucosal addressin cell adhesion molecule 1 [Propithecus coquereli]